MSSQHRHRTKPRQPRSIDDAVTETIGNRSPRFRSKGQEYIHQRAISNNFRSRRVGKREGVASCSRTARAAYVRAPSHTVQSAEERFPEVQGERGTMIRFRTSRLGRTRASFSKGLLANRLACVRPCSCRKYVARNNKSCEKRAGAVESGLGLILYICCRPQRTQRSPWNGAPMSSAGRTPRRRAPSISDGPFSRR
jgi:hypothetical protein